MKKPNILLITSDQQHFNTIGAFNKEIRTPNLDRLVKEGTTFMKAYCPNPTCTPTRASIITGKYPSQHGAWTLGTKLPETEPVIGNELKKVGYKTALIGKAHFQPVASTEEYSSIEAPPLIHNSDFWKNFDENFYGFDHIELTRNHTNENLVGQHYVLWLEEKGCKNWRDYFLPPTGTMDIDSIYKWDIPEEYHYNNWIAERTNCMLDNYAKDEDSFFLWSSFFDPHPLYLAPEPFDTMYDETNFTVPQLGEGEHIKNPPHFKLTQESNPDISAYQESGYHVHGVHSHKGKNKEIIKKDMSVYYGMVTLMDKYIGRILDKLDELGIADNTIVIFTSDHGHFFGQHGLHKKGPFMYEDMIKVPFVVRYNKIVPSGVVSNSIQSLVDLAPTILDFCNLRIPKYMTGISQKEVWEGKKSYLREYAICEHHHEPTTVNLKTYIDSKYKITVYFNKEYGEIFDLINDPNEFNNLWDDERYSKLKSNLLLKFLSGLIGIEPMWMPRIADY